MPDTEVALNPGPKLDAQRQPSQALLQYQQPFSEEHFVSTVGTMTLQQMQEYGMILFIAQIQK